MLVLFLIQVTKTERYDIIVYGFGMVSCKFLNTCLGKELSLFYSV